jgi:hypothetical protein
MVHKTGTWSKLKHTRVSNVLGIVERNLLTLPCQKSNQGKVMGS